MGLLAKKKIICCFPEIQIKLSVLYFHLQPHFPFLENRSALHLVPVLGPRCSADNIVAATTLSDIFYLKFTG